MTFSVLADAPVYMERFNWPKPHEFECHAITFSARMGGSLTLGLGFLHVDGNGCSVHEDYGRIHVSNTGCLLNGRPSWLGRRARA
jgi:hypothetical protein